MRRLGINRYTTLFLAASIWFLSKFIRYAFPPLFETLQASYGISNALMGTVYTALLTVYALLQFPSGMLSDRFGSVEVIVVGVGLTALGSFLLVFDLPVYVLFGAVLLIGVGTGVHKTVAVRILSKVYPERTGRVLGIYDTFGSYGGVGASAVVTAFLIVPPALGYVVGVLPGAPWRGVFMLSGCLGLLLAVGFATYVPAQLPDESEEVEDTAEAAPRLADYLAQLVRPRFFAFLVVAVLFSFSYNGAVAFLPRYLSEVAGLDVAVANLLYSALFAVSVVQIATGDISDRVGRLPVIVLSLGLSGIALLLAVTFVRVHVAVLGFLIVSFAVGSHGFRPVRGAYLVELLPEWIVAGGFGIVRTILMIAGAASPPIIGYVADVSDFRIAFAVLAVAMVGATILSGGLLVLEWRRPTTG